MKSCAFIRKRILELAYNAGCHGAHLGGCLSLVEILEAIYSQCQNFDIQDENRDRLILSKGHGALALYCVLEKKGLLSSKDVESFETNGTELFAHAKRNPLKGIEFSGGSLGLGMSFAVGVALACKDQKKNNRIFVIVGDGECNEGIVWESIWSAAHYRLDNLIIIVDNNKLQSDGFTKDVLKSENMEDKFAGFGCETIVVDGHSVSALCNAISADCKGKPKVIVAHTKKGKGVSFLENQQTSHHVVLSRDLYEQALKEVEG